MNLKSKFNYIPIRDNEILRKQLAGEFKSVIKTSSKDYMDKLQSELMKGFKTYYDELNNKVIEELSNQEAQQKELHSKLEAEDLKGKTIRDKLNKLNQSKLNAMINYEQLKLKSNLFSLLFKNKITKTNTRKRVNTLMKVFHVNRLHRIFNGIKKVSLHERTQAYDAKIKTKTEGALHKTENDMKKQCEDMWELIRKAEEKLKHENRKKVQAKLQLDQIVLRGISELNFQALSLSQNSLNGNILDLS